MLAATLFLLRINMAQDMAAKKKLNTLSIKTGKNRASLILKELEYLGAEGIRCILELESNGFSCSRPFAFDNDEYFLAKLREVCNDRNGNAELTNLYEESTIKIEPANAGGMIVSGMIVDEDGLYQALEFAFSADEKLIQNFLAEFEKMVKLNMPL